MTIFSKKSVFVIAAMLAACVMFAGCGGGDPNDTGTKKGKDTTNNKPVDPPSGDAVNLLSGSEWIGDGTWAPDDNAMACGAWYYHFEFASIENVQLKSGEISWKATLGEEPEEGEDEEEDEDAEWPYAEMCVATGGFLGEKFKIYLTYTSDQDIEFGLLDNSPESGKGAGFSAALKKGNNVKVTLDKSKFKQPNWAAGDGLTYTLDLSKVDSFAFSAGDNYGKSVNVKVTQFEVEELFWDDD